MPRGVRRKAWWPEHNSELQGDTDGLALTNLAGILSRNGIFRGVGTLGHGTSWKIVVLSSHYVRVYGTWRALAAQYGFEAFICEYRNGSLVLIWIFR